MALTPSTTTALRKAGEYESRQNPPPATPGTTGHTSSSFGDGTSASGTGSTGDGGFLKTIGKGFAAALQWEKTISEPLASLPYPGMPASRSFSMIHGFPHAHDHWPNTAIIPPIPVPFMSNGPVIPLPVVSCADKVFIKTRKAVRCGDLGLSFWCGGYVPLNEVFLGSASVWIESARAGRLLDMTKQCIITKFKMKDHPLGPPIGALTTGAVFNVLIGGAPMPSVIGLALVGGMKGAGQAAKLFRAAAIGTRNLVGRFIVMRRFSKFVQIVGDDAFKKAVIQELRKIAWTKVGRARLNQLVNAGQPLKIKPLSVVAIEQPKWAKKGGPMCVLDNQASYVRTTPDPQSPLIRQYYDQFGNRTWSQREKIAGYGQPGGSTIYYNPGQAVNGTPSDVVLFHETGHANNAARGDFRNHLTRDDPAFQKQWQDVEEYGVVRDENAYRAETGRPARTRY